MARSIFGDVLQSQYFWLVDVAPIDSVALPVLTPLFGFSSISTPEIQAETTEIVEGNWFFKRQVITRASVSNIVLQRAATFYDSDFWRWTMAAITGNPAAFGSLGIPVGGPTPRRDLVLLQFLPQNPIPPIGGSTAAGSFAASVVTGAAVGLIAGNAVQGLITGGITAASAALNALGIGPFEFAPRIPARAWGLKGVLPVKYKPSNDFDASAAAISVQELEVSVHYVEEFSLTAS